MSNIEILKTEAQLPYKRILEQHNTDRLLVLSKQAVLHQLKQLRFLLPDVQPYFAIKSCPHPALLDILHADGCNFDVATSGEIKMLQDLGVNSDRTIHTHPIKTLPEIRASLDYGCNIFVVDNMTEIKKFMCDEFKGRFKFLLRLSFTNPDAAIDLSRKFGCKPVEAAGILKFCKDNDMEVVGLSFHVGSQSKNNKKYLEAIATCKDILAAHPYLSILDIGGGYPITYTGEPIDNYLFFDPIRAALWNLPAGIRVISEPGRFISGPTITCISTVVGVSEREGVMWYYLNDGVYGSYSGLIYDHIQYRMNVFNDSTELFQSVLTGPTCDSIDMIAVDVMLPKMEVGDIIVGHHMGAYTMATSSNFNCISAPDIITIDSWDNK